MKLQKIKDQYSDKKISKAEFIDAMYGIHSVLPDYSNFLKKSGISAIEILDDKIIFTSRETHYHKGGLKFYCDIEDKRTTPLEAFNFGSYEAEDSEMLYKLLEKDYTVFDVGGNIGWYTNHMAALLTHGRVYSFEPIPETFTKLTNNVKLNQFPNIELYNIALSDKIGALTFYYSPFMSGASSSQNITENNNAVLVECKTNTIDQFVNDNSIQQIDFIKCDVEGAELFVFKGGLQTIARDKPIVFSEMLRKWAAKFGYHPNDIIALFTEKGYSSYVIKDGFLAKLELVDESTEETNFFFLHNEKHSSKIATFCKEA
jgi:FkbM family methyltransferase